MQKLTAYRSSHRAYNLLLFVISFTFLIVWLPLLRAAFDGESYQWGYHYFGTFLNGKGVTLSYLFIVIEAIFYVAFFLSVYWIKNRTVFYVLLSVWWVHFFGNMLFEIAKNPALSFQGETMGVNVPLMYIVLPLCLIAIALVVWVIRVDRNSEEVEIPWSKKNQTLTIAIFGPLPLQFILLHFGPHLSGMDQIGVVITIAQCLLIPLIVRPYLPKFSAAMSS